MNVDAKLQCIHNRLKIKYGSLNEELPEQKMVVKYFTGNEKVLELGANIGRNSLVIGYILRVKDNNNFVTLETDPNICKQLIENRDLNFMDFFIENSALSNRKLIQRGWDTIVSEELLQGYIPVNTISLYKLYEKYNINFDTLIIDCEGAFYYILMDMPEMLNNINLIIMENDYLDINHKLYIDNILKQKRFYRDFVQPGGWGPCEQFFFEVWKR
jgi:FkbM family methyltransferase